MTRFKGKRHSFWAALVLVAVVVCGGRGNQQLKMLPAFVQGNAVMAKPGFSGVPKIIKIFHKPMSDHGQFPVRDSKNFVFGELFAVFNQPSNLDRVSGNDNHSVHRDRPTSRIVRLGRQFLQVAIFNPEHNGVGFEDSRRSSSGVCNNPFERQRAMLTSGLKPSDNNWFCDKPSTLTVNDGVGVEERSIGRLSREDSLYSEEEKRRESKNYQPPFRGCVPASRIIVGTACIWGACLIVYKSNCRRAWLIAALLLGNLGSLVWFTGKRNCTENENQTSNGSRKSHTLLQSQNIGSMPSSYIAWISTTRL